ncbi:Na+/H+ antiporter subunit E [Amaricoccus solimangrovi]|uniref:Na+/H+ antiporter subunit E n=1 Tax=Amaricoccus solimangrovi TaxID=2589815 RepID=A0A501WQI7_9RHOB|nr:Na+/H+ antiporter subunit E [Amaricoccus solimangrovi]TPE49251.1 Na+/H+ antiporter subunit E [Amaricoccus solimangrovi]
MTRHLPHPILTATVILMWLLLNRFSVGHLLLGALVGVIAGKAMSALRPPRVRPRRWWLIPGLALRVLGDIGGSNLAVAGQILRGAERRVPGFVEIGLRLRDPFALGILATILTAMPGTAWIQYDRASGRLLLHALDLGDGTDWAGIVRERYEGPLMEIFE